MKLKLLELSEVKGLILTGIESKNQLLESLISEQSFKLPTNKLEKAKELDIQQLLKDQMSFMEKRFNTFDSKFDFLENKITTDITAVKKEIKVVKEKLVSQYM